MSCDRRLLWALLKYCLDKACSELHFPKSTLLGQSVWPKSVGLARTISTCDSCWLLPHPHPQVTEALETVGRLVSVTPLIPDLVERLHALKELHERAAQFAGSVAYIADSQDQLATETRELKSLLAQVSCLVKGLHLHKPLYVDPLFRCKFPYKPIWPHFSLNSRTLAQESHHYKTKLSSL